MEPDVDDKGATKLRDILKADFHVVTMTAKFQSKLVNDCDTSKTLYFNLTASTLPANGPIPLNLQSASAMIFGSQNDTSTLRVRS